MATKVKGEAIKEDSIPLRGLKPFIYELYDAEDYAEFKNAIKNKKSGFIIIQDYSIFQEVYITNSRYFGGNNYRIEGIANGKFYINNFIDISDNPTIIFKTEHEIKPDVPNWKAQYGESGYIANKPFEINYNVGIKLSDVNILDFNHKEEYNETIIELEYAWGDYILYIDAYDDTYIEDIYLKAVQIELPNGYIISLSMEERYNEEYEYNEPYIKCTIWDLVTQEIALECLSYIKIHDVKEDYITQLPDIFIDEYKVLKPNKYVGPYYAKSFRKTLELEPMWTYMFNKINVNGISKLPDDVVTALKNKGSKEKACILHHILCLSYDNYEYKLPTLVNVDGIIYFDDTQYSIDSDGNVEEL